MRPATLYNPITKSKDRVYGNGSTKYPQQHNSYSKGENTE